ncbi:type II secretion system protein GspM [Sphingomonas sp. BIUV-7]|uniref:Type II secretion system protein GspM n=1 Tax=Sphingomonas natans TaxID=3063330 RepID=A0ABT8Y6S3_9SPHN|nr:type II secretion system protein GspM [Sphingomonas sp. BIUV-7]MDO6413608.1 type II secretion system protein GspM [Sphingomonas sp. BIUV-7]
MKLGSLAPWWDRGTLWWSGRSQREQVLLGVLAALGTLAILMALVVRPLETARAQATADIRTYDMLAMRLRAAGPGMAGAAARHGPPAGIVAASAGATGVTVQRVEPESGRLTVVLADAPFDAVLRFVADLERTSSLRVGEARIEASATGPGLVTARFVLAGG